MNVNNNVSMIIYMLNKRNDCSLFNREEEKKKDEIIIIIICVCISSVKDILCYHSLYKFIIFSRYTYAWQKGKKKRTNSSTHTSYLYIYKKKGLRVIDGGRNEQISQQLYVLYVRHRRERGFFCFGEV